MLVTFHLGSILSDKLVSDTQDPSPPSKNHRNGKDGEIKARKWAEEKELLDKCDGLATAAGSESEHERGTIYNVYT